MVNVPSGSGRALGLSGAGHRRDLQCVRRRTHWSRSPPRALPQSPVPELLDAFRTGEGVDLIRESVRLVMQELIEVEATEQIGATALSGSPAPPIATALVRGCWPPRPATWS